MYEVELGAPEWVYTPKWRGNDQTEKPGTVKLRLLSVEEQEDCLGFSAGGGMDRKAMFRAGVVEFNGWKIGGKAIKTADDVLEARGPLYGLFAEIWLEINNKCFLGEADSKNS